MWTLCRVKRSCYYFFVFAVSFILFILPSYFPSFSIFIYISITISYFVTNFIKIFLFLVGMKIHDIKNYYKKDNLKISDDDLPIYSILLPVRKEKEFVLVNLLTAIYNLDYPSKKLDIKLVIDENDKETIEIGEMLLNRFKFDLIIVPNSNIKSKPMSCSFALKFMKGKFLTIYDAEDRPEKYQLKKSIERFNELGEDYVCLQAALNYYNKYDNFISYCFSLEYSMWFDFTIKAISKYATFFPLGGTSNHFRTDKLIELGGWDGYNVTEDAELGIRIARAGYKVSILNSITEEECPITVKAWIKQRTRWIKGFMQTFCEHTMLKNPVGIKSKHEFKPIRKLKFFDIIIYHSFVMMSFFFFISIVAVFFNHVVILHVRNFEFLTFIIYANLFSLFAMIYGAFIAVVFKNKMKINFLYFLLFPLYWVLHYIAAFYALKGLIFTPFYWAKTEHGISKTVKIK